MLANLPPIVSPNKAIDELYRVALSLVLDDEDLLTDLWDLACDGLGTGDCTAQVNSRLAPNERMAVAILRAGLEINRLIP
jgi:hypothetical protein